MTAKKSKRVVYVEPDHSQQAETIGEVPTGVVIPLPPELATLLGGLINVGHEAMALAAQVQGLASKAQALQVHKTGRPRRR